jgi:hypothetical protein
LPTRKSQSYGKSAAMSTSNVSPKKQARKLRRCRLLLSRRLLKKLRQRTEPK